MSWTSVPKMSAFPSAAAVKLEVVVLNEKWITDGTVTKASKGLAPVLGSLGAGVKVRVSLAEGGLDSIGLFRSKCPLSICKPM